MVLSGIGKRYALALFNASTDEEMLEQVHGDVVSFARLIESEAAFHRFLVSLRVTPAEKKELVTRAIANQASGLFVKFVLLLIDKKRIGKFGEIARSFQALYEERQGILEVSVITAVPLDTEMERKAKETIERRTGKTARIVKRVDPDIIGGMILLAGDRIIDGSIRNRLVELRRELHELRVH